jgi:hypothetical protein
MTVDQGTILIGIVTLIVAVLTLLAAYTGLGISRRTEFLTEQAVHLAEDEASRRSMLQVSGMRLLNAIETEPVAKAVSERRTWLTARQKYRQGKGSEPPRDHRGYEGPWPDRVLEVVLSNVGKAAALDVYGRIRIDGGDLWPVDFPALPADVDLQGGSLFSVNLRTPEGSRLLPEPTDQQHRFYVPVRTTRPVRKASRPITTVVKYDFSTLQGDSIEGDYSLEIPYLEPEEVKWIKSFEPDRW